MEVLRKQIMRIEKRGEIVFFFIPSHSSAIGFILNKKKRIIFAGRHTTIVNQEGIINVFIEEIKNEDIIQIRENLKKTKKYKEYLKCSINSHPVIYRNEIKRLPWILEILRNFFSN